MGGFWCDTCGTWQPTESEAARQARLSTLSARVVEAAVMVEHYEKAMDPYNDRHLSDAEWREWCDLRDLRDEARLALRAAVDALIAERQR